MRIHRLALSALLLTCSCRFLVDPDQFRDKDAGNDGLPDAIVSDALASECSEWRSKYIALDLTTSPDEPVLVPEGEYYFDGDTLEIKNTDDGEPVASLEVRKQRNETDALVLWGKSVIISENAVIRVAYGTAPPPLIIAAEESIVIDGTIDVSSDRNSLGPGAGLTECEPFFQRGSTTSMTGGGGGGGGFGREGAEGGPVEDFSFTAGGGGSAISGSLGGGIRGGCPGGEGGVCTGTATAGGYGGGAVHLVTCGNIILKGTIHAGGGGGRGAAPGTEGGGGGGGSGGYIGLEAPAIRFIEGATLAANGGGGGGGATSDANEYIFDGEPGRPSAAPASGGSQPSPSGRGGAGDFLPEPGANGVVDSHGGGGGGGGQGYILLIGGEIIDSGAVVSPDHVEETLN